MPPASRRPTGRPPPDRGPRIGGVGSQGQVVAAAATLTVGPAVAAAISHAVEVERVEASVLKDPGPPSRRSVRVANPLRFGDHVARRDEQLLPDIPGSKISRIGRSLPFRPDSGGFVKGFPVLLKIFRGDPQIGEPASGRAVDPGNQGREGTVVAGFGLQCARQQGRGFDEVGGAEQGEVVECVRVVRMVSGNGPHPRAEVALRDGFAAQASKRPTRPEQRQTILGPGDSKASSRSASAAQAVASKRSSHWMW